MVDLRRTDVRFVLPFAVERARVLGELPAWHEALETAGVDVGGRSEQGAVPDIAVAPAPLAAAAIATGARAVLIVGAGGDIRAVPAVAGAGLTTQRYLTLPDSQRPDVVLRLGDRAAARAVFEGFRPAETRANAVRNVALSTLAGLDLVRSPTRVALVGIRAPGPPFLLSAARELGVDAASSWFLALGGGDRLSRAVLHVVPPGRRRPSVVIKFSRVRGYSLPFDREQRAFSMLERAGPAVTTHAPRLIGRLQVAGLEASVESAASGRTLAVRLQRASTGDGVALIERVASWVVAVTRETGAAAPAIERELARLRDDVLPHWRSAGATEQLLSGLQGIAATLQHNDLGTWNVIGERHDFVAVDWESAREHGLPLWDLLYFLVDALARLDRARTPEERTAHAVRLLRGDLPSSPLLFRWIRTAVAAASVPADAVGRIATLCWLSHGLSHLHRSQGAGAALAAGSSSLPPAERLAPLWLSDPLLGPGWDRWRV